MVSTDLVPDHVMMGADSPRMWPVEFAKYKALDLEIRDL